MTTNRDLYGARETNPLPAGYHEAFPSNAPLVDWTDTRLARVTRLRLLSDPGFPVWDVSYCHGQLRDGTLVRVQLPFSQLPKRAMRKTIVMHAKRDGVYAVRLGIFNAISTLL
jgi:hypothetical protein